jgi:hypothetical protein
VANEQAMERCGIKPRAIGAESVAITRLLEGRDILGHGDQVTVT